MRLTQKWHLTILMIHRCLPVAALALAFVHAGILCAQTVSLSPDRADGIHAVGDTVPRTATGTDAPEFTVQPRSLTIRPGQRLTLWAEATSPTPTQFQWLRNGTPIPGAVGRFHEVASAGAGDAGIYTIEASNLSGTTTSAAATVAVDPTSSARLANMSIRCSLSEGGSVLIPGFVLSGSGTREILVRAVGPTLGTLGVTGWMPDPFLILYSDSNPIASNARWIDAENASYIEQAAYELGAFPLPAGSQDAAVYVSLPPAPFTVHITDGARRGGIVLVELYDAGGMNSRIANISGRADIGSGESIMIPGFVLAGSGAATLLIRAVGPGLAGLSVTDFVANPRLTLYQEGQAILANDDWGDAPDPAAIAAAAQAVGAFPLQPGSRDAVMLVQLMPGIYTVHAAGVDGGTGNVLVEVYDVF